MKESHAAFFARGRDMGADDDAVSPTALEYVVPKVWTIEHVFVRLIHACKVIDASVGHVGPKAVRTAWPAIVGGWRQLLSVEEQDFVIDLERRQRARRKIKGALDPRKIDWRAYVPSDVVRSLESDAAEMAGRRGEQATQSQVAMAEDALRWPARFLADEVLQADALMIWAWTKSNGRSLEKLLRARNMRAEALIAYRLAEERAAHEKRRREIAREALDWGRSLAEGANADRGAILVAMHDRTQEMLRASGLIEPPRPTRPEDVAPGECYTRKAVDTFRWKGAAQIMRALHLAREQVR